MGFNSGFKGLIAEESDHEVSPLCFSLERCVKAWNKIGPLINKTETNWVLNKAKLCVLLSGFNIFYVQWRAFKCKTTLPLSDLSFETECSERNTN